MGWVWGVGRGHHVVAYHTLEKKVVLSEACPDFGNMTRLVDSGKCYRQKYIWIYFRNILAKVCHNMLVKTLKICTECWQNSVAT